MPNIEIKARYKDLEKGRRIARRLGARHLGRDHQVDTYFKTAAGRLKLRESSLSGGQLIPYLRSDRTGPKKSDYVLLPAGDPARTKRLLGALLGVDTVVEKRRDIYLVGNVRVHLDEVVGLGTFFELEAVYSDESRAAAHDERRKVLELLRVFEVAPGDLLQGSYREAAHGQDAAADTPVGMGLRSRGRTLPRRRIRQG